MDTPKLNRLPPPYIENITIGDTSYYLDNIKDQEVNASTTYLLAIDEDYEELWRVAIYQTRFNKDIETDVQEVFPTKLDYNRDNHSFVIENENGDIFTFDLTTFVVMELQ